MLLSLEALERAKSIAVRAPRTERGLSKSGALLSTQFRFQIGALHLQPAALGF